jgi:tRNA(Ile)-lysidine synthase
MLPGLPLPELPAGARIWVAYSGGCDSSVLLHWLQAAGVPGLQAVHVHHGLQAAADDWIGHCRATCRHLRVPLKLLRVKVAGDHSAGPEAAAREARYAALRRLLRPGDLLATAHHRDDQAETLLLRLLRGTGIAGAAAMRPLSDFPPGRLWRPLLEVPRARLRAYAVAQGLEWVEDPHNSDPAYSRSWLRSEVMPLLRQRWPQAGDSLARFAGQAAETAGLLEALADGDLAKVRRGQGLSVAELLTLPPPRRHNLMHRWLALDAGETPASGWLLRCDRELLAARPDGNPCLSLGGHELRRYRDRLYLMRPLMAAPKHAELDWRRGRSLVLPADCGRLLAAGKLDAPLIVRFPQGGERLRPAPDAPSRSLKNLFQQAGVPVWVRERTPLLYRDGQLLAVGSYWRQPEFAQTGPQIVWETALAGAFADKH